jgi:hypothetical protein
MYLLLCISLSLPNGWFPGYCCIIEVLYLPLRSLMGEGVDGGIYPAGVAVLKARLMCSAVGADEEG